MNTREVYEALLAHYRKPGEIRDGVVLIPEAAAPGSDRRADLVAISTWRSRGTGIDVHEIKVSRSDWLRELADPAKAEPWWPHCSRFWITAPNGIVQPDELPDGWGLMTPPARANARRFTVAVKPAVRTPRLTLELLVTLLSRADNVRLNEMDRMRAEHRAERSRLVEEARRKVAVEGLPHQVRQRLDLIDKLEADLGVALDDYTSNWGYRNTISTGDAADVLRTFTSDYMALKDRAEKASRMEERLVTAAKVLIDSLSDTSA